MNKPVVTKLSFNRPNLKYEVMPKKSHKQVIKDMATLIKSKYKYKCGIVYCLSRRNCEDVSNALNKELGGRSVSFYHANLDADERQRRHENWSNDNGIRIMCATIAFGMGNQQARRPLCISLLPPKKVRRIIIKKVAELAATVHQLTALYFTTLAIGQLFNI